ncbi:cellulase family glycosylhydrolase [Elioraea sp.]|uniref:cellulase family glycosylhydrolase n=1 Tax=Elioraea sp. TaxID=2185103 RepID=UPI0025C40E42|nr:cellulase family glycosylhydrolase [Elioraea sp.]
MVLRLPRRQPARFPGARRSLRGGVHDGFGRASVADVPWPLGGDFGINPERNYLIGNSSGIGVPLGVAENMARHAHSVRVFPASTNDLGHGADLNVLFPANPDANGNFGRLRTSIDHFLAAGMTVLYCIIPGSPGTQDPHLMAPAVRQAYWTAFSAWIAANYTPDEVVIQPWNESAGAYSQAQVNALAAEAITAIRAGAPDHWIAISGRDSGRIWDVANLVLPAGIRRVAVDIHDYDTTRDGSATWYGKPFFVANQIRRLSQIHGYTVPVFFGEIDIANAAGTTEGYAVDNPLRITELLTFREALATNLPFLLTPQQIADIGGGVATLMWAWTTGAARRINDPASTVTSDWRPALNTAFFPAEPPSFVSPPEIAGTVQVGGTVSAEAAIARGTEPITRAYRWLRGASMSGAFSPIAGATGPTYLGVSADLGQYWQLEETLTNSAGVATATSAVVGPVLASAPPPEPEPPGDAPTALVVRAIGPSHLAMFDGNNAATHEDGSRGPDALPVDLRTVDGRSVWAQELQAAIPALPITFARTVQAGTGISHWATDTAITAAGQSAITSWLSAAGSNPTAKCIFLIFCAVQEWSREAVNLSTDSFILRHRRIVEAALAQFDAAYPARDREVWVMVPGNRWNTDSDSANKIRRTLILTGDQADASETAIPGFYAACHRAGLVLGDTRTSSSDGIHYPIGVLQGMGRELALAMLHRWGLADDAPRLVTAWRSAAQVIRARVRLGDAANDFIAAPGTHNNGLWRAWNGTGWVYPSVGTVDTTFKALGFVDIPLTFSANIIDTATLHFATDKYVATYSGSQTVISVPHEVPAGNPGLTKDHLHLYAPRPRIRTLVPQRLVVATTPPPDPGAPPPADVRVTRAADTRVTRTGDRRVTR